MADSAPYQGESPPGESFLTQAYEDLSEGLLTDMALAGVPRDERGDVLNEGFFATHAELGKITSLKRAKERLTENVYKRAGQNRKEARKRRRKEHLTSDTDSFARSVQDLDGDEDGQADEIRKLAPPEVQEIWSVLEKCLKGRQLTVMKLRCGRRDDGRYGEVMPYRQIAHLLGVSWQTVFKAVKRAEANLEKHKGDFARFDS
ncbi:hypothetical protein [Streptomyces adustus]